MRYFSPNEFIRNNTQWLDFCDPKLLEYLDEFRHQWGSPVSISASPFALGRHQGPDGRSQHNVDKDGILRAADIMPTNINSKEDMERAVALAEYVGFNGIGIYPHWQPRVGLHVDVRPNRARWAGIRNRETGIQTYISLQEGLEFI